VQAAVSKAKSQKPRDEMSAYVAALHLLSRRELSEKQVRERLTRRGYEGDEIDDAVQRLKNERAIDDARVAEAIARSQISIRRRGKLRVRMAIQQAGIRGDTVDNALEAAFGDVDQGALLQAALSKRLKGDRPIADDREFRRLYRYLVGQGFESDRALKALNARRSR
jgi:regulatory protein